MVVLTPNDQLKNTSYRVSDHTFDTICQELRRAKNILKAMAPESKIILKQSKTTDLDYAENVIPEEETKSQTEEQEEKIDESDDKGGAKTVKITA